MNIGDTIDTITPQKTLPTYTCKTGEVESKNVDFHLKIIKS